MLTVRLSAAAHTPAPRARSYALDNPKGLKFAALNKLKRHYQSVHSGEQAYACTFCTRGFSTKDKQRTHEKWCHVRAHCVCGASFSNIESLTANSKARKGHLHQGRTCPKSCAARTCCVRLRAPPCGPLTPRCVRAPPQWRGTTRPTRRR